MQTSHETDKLLGALVKAQSEMLGVQMDAVNPYYKSHYATLGAVIQSTRPTLGKYGLAIIQFPIGSMSRVGLETVVTHESGQWMSNEIYVDTGETGKNPAQEAGIILSYLRRYSWSAVCGIYTEEDTDGEGVSPKSAPPIPKPTTNPITKWSLDQVNAAMETKAFANEIEAKAAMEKSTQLKKVATPPEGITFWVTHYKENRVVAKMTPQQAAEAADSEYLAEKIRIQQDNTEA
jgi:hypothetical protein